MGRSPLASVRPESPPQLETLASAPVGFFMTVRDVAFWIRSWRADSQISRARQEHGAASAFDNLYAGAKDPFGAELPQYRYQQRKYNSLLAMLPRRRYQSVLDIGCGLGAFTRKIAPFSQAVLGTDISEVAIAQARELSREHANVTYSVQAAMESPGQQAAFDLIILADTLYYTDSPTVERIELISSQVASKLMPGGLLLLVNHYFFGIDSASRATRAAHDVFRSGRLLHCVAEYRRAFFLATLLQRPEPKAA